MGFTPGLWHAFGNGLALRQKARGEGFAVRGADAGYNAAAILVAGDIRNFDLAADRSSCGNGGFGCARQNLFRVAFWPKDFRRVDPAQAHRDLYGLIDPDFSFYTDRIAVNDADDLRRNRAGEAICACGGSSQHQREKYNQKTFN